MPPTSNIGTYSINDAETELQGMAHGTTLNSVVDLFGCFNRAARRVMEDVDPQETKIIAAMPSPIYNGVFDYPLFTDVKGNKVIDLYPQANRTLLDNYEQRYNKDFDLYKNISVKADFTPRYSNAIRTVRINASNLVNGIQVNDAAAPSDNGNWLTSGNASNPQQNSLFFSDGAASSLQITLNQTGVPASAGFVTNSSMVPVDLTQNYQNNAMNFFQVYIPNASAFTSLSFKLGSSANAYYHTDTITTNAMGFALQTGWNLISVPFASMSIQGVPNISAINYIQVGFVYNGTLQNQVLLNQFYSRIGVLFNMEYYSKYLFRDAMTGVFQEKVTDVSNVINLDTDGYNLFLFATGGEITQQVQGVDALFYDSTQFEQRYQASLSTYKAKYKSEIIKPQSNYYYQPRRGYRQFYGFGMGNGQGS